MIVNMYERDYLGSRALYDAISSSTGKSLWIITYSDLEKECNGLEEALNKCFNGNPEDYSYRLHMNSDFMAGDDDLFTSFLEGRFLRVKEAEEANPEQ